MRTKMNLKHYLVLFVIVKLSECYNILIIFGHPGKSHYDVFKPLFQELGERGHNLTILGHISTRDDIKNSRDVLLSNESLSNVMDLSRFSGTRLQKYLEVQLIADMAASSCEPGLQSIELRHFLKEDNKFDVILVEFFNSNCFYGLISKYKAPFIGLSSCSMMAWHPQWFGSPDNPSYISTLYMAYAPPMTFLERVENTIIHQVHKLWYKIFIERPGREVSKQYTGFEPANPYDASLYLLNTHHILHGVRPLTPGIVEVGGIHVANRKPKKLPKDLEKWISESTAGLIYFSLGSLIKGHTFPEEKRQAFVRSFSKLPQRVVWKWEKDMKDKPDNVMINKWLPQFDILCHPNTKVFISHGGLLGTTEAVHCGVPVIVMPQFGDQAFNAKALEKSGAGIILKFRESPEESITEAIVKALSPEFQEKTKKISVRFRDRLVPPLQTAAYWVEYVARYKGAEHIRSPAIDMPFYQYFLLDVIAFLTVTILIFSYTFCKCIVLALGLCYSRKVKLKTL